MATNNTKTNDFDFNAYNAVISKANAGLKLFLVTQLLGDVVTASVRYRNPMAGDLIKALETVEDLRTEWKLQAASGIQRQTQEQHASARRERPVADANEHQATVY